MTAAPAGLQAYQKIEKHNKLKRCHQQAPTRHVPDPALRRLRNKLEQGCISSTERSVLQVLETQTAAQAQTAARAKAAISKAAHADREPFTIAQTEARFKSRARTAEIAAAKARTLYVPEGPQTEEQEANDQDAAQPKFKRQRTSKASSNQEYWDCYFHRNHRSVRKSKPQAAPQTCDEEEENEYDQDPFSSDAQGSDSGSDCFDLDSDDSDAEAEEGCAGQQHQQHPQGFYKQPLCLVSVTSAFQQLVKFVKQLPTRVKEDKAAAHLTTFESRKVLTKPDLSSAARRIWLAVHPDKNQAPAAKEVSVAFSSLLDSLKGKGAL